MLIILQGHGVIFFEHCHLSGYAVFKTPLKMRFKYVVVFIMCICLKRTELVCSIGSGYFTEIRPFISVWYFSLSRVIEL